MITTIKICNNIKLRSIHLHTPVADPDCCRSSYGYPGNRSLVPEALLDEQNATYGESAPLELIKPSSNPIMFLLKKVALPLQAFTFDPRLARLSSEL